MGTVDKSNWHAHMIALAEETAHDLIGTCQSVASLGSEIEDAFDDSTFCARFDELAFECTRCSWWCSQDECNENSVGQWVCDDCADDN